MSPAVPLRRPTRWTRLRCRLRGGCQWSALPTAGGYVLLVCEGCADLSTVPFVDVPATGVFGLTDPEADRVGPFGDLAAGRAALRFIRAISDGDAAAARQERRILTARPGAGVDALGVFAEGLLRTLDTERSGGDRVWRDLFLAGWSARHDMEAMVQGIGMEDGR